MGTSPETFAKVKDILRKLDRSIDAARSRRLTDEDDQRNGHSNRESTPSPTPQQARPLRAKPLHRPGPIGG